MRTEGPLRLGQYRLCPRPGATCVRDCRTALPLPSGSRVMFTEHFFEHLHYYEEIRSFSKSADARFARGDSPGHRSEGAKYLNADRTGHRRPCGPSAPSWNGSHRDAVPLEHRGEVVPFRTRMEVVNFHFRQAGEHRFSLRLEMLSGLLEECGFESVVDMLSANRSWPNLAIDAEVRAAESRVVEATVPLHAVRPGPGKQKTGHRWRPWRRRPDSNRGTGLCRPLPKPLGHAALLAGRSA